MKKLVYTLLITTTLSSAGAIGAFANPVEVSSEHDKQHSVCSIDSFSQSIITEAPKAVAKDKGYKSVSHVNFSKEQADQAVVFADLAYKAYSAAGGEAEKVAQFNSMVTDLATNNWKNVQTFKGSTGHTILTDAFVKESTIGLMAQNNDKLVVAFRGTKDMLRDLAFTDAYALNGWLQKSRFNGNENIGVHAGFNKVFKSFQAELGENFINALRNSKEKINEVTLTGHSLGGALAQLATLYLTQLAEKEGFAVKFKIAAFNAPRVGSENFADALNNAVGIENVALYEIEGDVVRNVLLGFLGWKKAGTKVVVENDSWNLPGAHSHSNFKNGVAGEVTEKHNAEPVNKIGYREQFAQTKIGAAVFSTARAVKDNAINPVVNALKKNLNPVVDAVKDAAKAAPAKIVAGFNAIKGAIANQLTIKPASEAKPDGIRTQIRGKVDAVVQAAKVAVPQAAQKAKEAFVGGFQKVRSGIAGLFGY